jgi:hypothetical protein
LRHKIIDYFLGDPDDITEGQEMAFYCIMGLPLFVTLAVIIITL